MGVQVATLELGISLQPAGSESALPSLEYPVLSLVYLNRELCNRYYLDGTENEAYLAKSARCKISCLQEKLIGPAGSRAIG